MCDSEQSGKSIVKGVFLEGHSLHFFFVKIQISFSNLATDLMGSKQTLLFDCRECRNNSQLKKLI